MKFKPKHAAKHAGRVLQHNSPTLLSALAVVGVAATGFLTWKAGRQHAAVIEYNKMVQNTDKGPGHYVPLSPAEEFARVWKLYIPAAGVGALTIGCIVASNRIQVRRLAAMAAAYGVLTGDFDEYRNKALEVLGDKKAKVIDDKLAEEKILKNPPPKAIADADIHMLESGHAWFQDLSTGQNIISTRAKMEKARNDLNYYLMQSGFADLNEWYAFAGFESTNLGSQLGWNSDDKVEIVFTPVMLPDGTTATGMKLMPEARPDFDSLH